MISRFVQFKKLSQNDNQILKKYVLKSDAKMMNKNIEIESKNGAKIDQKIDAKNDAKMTPKREPKMKFGVKGGSL